MNKFKRLAIPYLVWILLFTCVPLLLMILFSFSNIEQFKIDKFDFTSIHFSTEPFQTITGSLFIQTFLRSIFYALISTILTLLIGYPIAYFISRSKIKHKYLLLLIFIMPMWTNMLLRVQTINNMLSSNSLLKGLFNIVINLNDFKSLKIILTMTIIYLPFMIFPIYTVLEKMDKALDEASHDLGANSIKTFTRVTLPISMKGVYSGIMMVFLPSAMGFTIPAIVTDGAKDYIMVGQLIEQRFKSSSPMYNIGSMWSLIIILFVLAALWVISKIDAEGETLL